MRLAAIFFDREIEMAETARAAPAWQAPLLRVVASPVPETHDLAARGLEALLTARDRGAIEATDREALLVEGRLVLVLAEAGKSEALGRRLASLESRGGEGAAVAATVRFAYGGGGEPLAGKARESLAQALAALEDERRPGPAWATDRLAARFAGRAQDAAGARAAEGRLSDRATRARARAAALGLVWLALATSGLLLGAALVVTRRPLGRVGSGVAVAPWPAGDGYAVITRAALWGLALVVAYELFAEALEGTRLAALPFQTLVGALPLLYYLRRRLLPPHGVELATVFGLRREGRARDLLVATLVLTAIEQALSAAIGIGAAAARRGVWHESLSAEVVNGTRAEAVGFFIEAIAWAPLFEEIACRGLIYTSLRTRLAPWPAALLSAAVFTLPHIYSLPASLTLFAGAVASALVYERTRSLLPCIAAHAANNAFLWRW
jgi:membrane protease YdiL (CAAX protease family)